MNRVFLDLDGVVVDLDALARELGVTGDVLKRLPGAYLRMKPMAGALEGIREIMAIGFSCFIASKAPSGVPVAYGEKTIWVATHIPALADRVIITPDKGLLGDEHDYLVDDRPHKTNCRAFRGRLFHFGPDGQWPELVTYFRHEKTNFSRTVALP